MFALQRKFRFSGGVPRLLARAGMLLPAGMLLCAGPAMAGDDIAAAVAAGKAGIDLRYRYDQVEDDAFLREANASTLRTRLNYTTGQWHDTVALVEMDNVSRIGDDRYYDLRNGKVMYPMVPDPDGTDLNQASLTWRGIEDMAVVAGRQRLNFDNQRFIGGSAGRQNEQTFDALTLEYRSVEKLVATFAWVGQVNRVVGPDAGLPPPELDSEMSLLNVNYRFAPAASVTAYHYAMDFDDAPALSNATSGLRLTGELPAGELKFVYALEGAQQGEYARQPVDYSANYLHGELKLVAGSHWLALGNETLGADGAMRFITPLATLKFHGLAEKFWQTPDGGIVDNYVKAGTELAGWRLSVALHQLAPETGPGDFGEEADFTAFRAFGKHYQLLFVHTLFDVDGPAYTNAAFPFMAFDDTRKTYLALMAKF